MNKMSKSSYSDSPLQSVTASIVNGQAVLVAHKLGFFRLISEGPKSLQEISQALDISLRSSQALVSATSCFGLTEMREEKCILSPTGVCYLKKDDDFYYGPVFDIFLQTADVFNFSSIENAIRTNKSVVDHGNDIFSNDDGIANEASFVRGLNQKAIGSAFFWPSQVDLSDSRCFVDIGGGSGIHCIGACLHNRKLSGVVCDRKAVLKHAKRNIQEYKLRNTIDAFELDLFSSENFPSGDVHFYGDIFHDWTPEQCLMLAKKSFRALPSGGRILLHEMLFHEDKSGPWLTSAYNLKMLLWTEGQQFTFSELEKILTNAGFKSIERIDSIGNWSIISGTKP